MSKGKSFYHSNLVFGLVGKEDEYDIKTKVVFKISDFYIHFSEVCNVGQINIGMRLDSIWMDKNKTPSRQRRGMSAKYSFAEDRRFYERIYLTLVDSDVVTDTFFPEWDEQEWAEKKSSYFAADEQNQYPVVFRILKRVAA